MMMFGDSVKAAIGAPPERKETLGPHTGNPKHMVEIEQQYEHPGIHLLFFYLARILQNPLIKEGFLITQGLQI